mgnify:CR=1 FL=1
MRSTAILTLLLLPLLTACGEEKASNEASIKIGDSFAYTSFARFGEPYRNGWQLAVQEVNANGGVCLREDDCRKLDVTSVDHGATPDQALRTVEGLVERDEVDVLAGTILGNVTNAIGSYAGHREIPLVTLWSSVLAEEGPQNPFMFSIMPFEPHALASADLAATMPIKRWALIGPDMAWGRSGNALFKKRLKELRPDVEIVTEQWPAVSNFNSSAEFSALRHAQPEGIFSSLFGSDLFAFIREGHRLNFFEGKTIIGTELTQAAHLNVIGGEIKQGKWYGTGYPAAHINTPEHTKFYEAYKARYNEPPELYALAGYSLYKVIAAAIQEAGSLDKEKVRTALQGIVVETPMGELEVFAHNHRADFGVWLGKVADGDMPKWEYYPARKYIGKN